VTQGDRAPARRQAFVDTSAFYALASQRDADFATAQRILRRLQRERWTTVTTTYIVAETHALFLGRSGREAASTFLRNLLASSTERVRPSELDEQGAIELVFRYTDKTFSLTDAISFVVMERMGISAAFTFDRDFVRYGFRAVQA
jgi:predicted nucleic acid-binding protein